MARAKNDELRDFILRSIPQHAGDIVRFTVETCGTPRATVNHQLRQLVAEGLVDAEGKTNARQYRLKVLDTYKVGFPIQNLQEDVVLRQYVGPHFAGLPKNIVDICDYGFLEILNNAIEHSEGEKCFISVQRNYAAIEIAILDDGVGIFDKISKVFHLENKNEAILELAKGKITTNKENHSGEGIFFTSKMFDHFYISSGGLVYIGGADECGQNEDNEGWMIEEDIKKGKGTFVLMKIFTDASRTSRNVFDAFLDDEARFAKTHFPLSLASYEGERLVSRSQARRLMSRIERFSEAILDFRGIDEVGQAFADEIFRVWARNHPTVEIHPVHVSDQVNRMILHAFANAAEDAQEQKP